jgi:hypothetical protein
LMQFVILYYFSQTKKMKRRGASRMGARHT